MEDADSHGKMYPPEDILKEQCEFLRSLACFVQKSSIQPPRRNTARNYQDPGQGAFVGRGIAKGTFLVYSGLLFFGDYDEEKMSELWETKFNEKIARNWQNKVYRLDNKHWIIGSPYEWTSNLNSNPVNALCHASICSGDLGLMQFYQAAFSFDEVILCYLGRIPVNADSLHGPTKKAISEHLSAEAMKSNKREVRRLISDLTASTEPALSAEKTFKWHEDKDSNAGGSKKKKKKTAVSGSAEGAKEEEEEAKEEEE